MISIKTIYSLCTPPILSALHIIRICGPKTYEVINKITTNSVSKKGYSLQKNFIKDKDSIIDEVILAKYVAPKSFTGEDTVEIICHGSLAVISEILSLLQKSGAEQAQKGEFTKTALLNNKIDLTQAEAINSLILSESKMPLLLSNKALNGETKKVIYDLKEKLLLIMGIVEVNIDYPEYDDVEKMDQKKLKIELTNLSQYFLKILNQSKKVIPIINGVNVAIVGKPNVGKSSLLNSLLKQNKAIVSNVAGTTRDTVEGKINIEGLTINILDTAGIRKSKNRIEKLGINKSIDLINQADLVILVLDSSKNLTRDDTNLLEMTKDKKRIVVLNKSDLPRKAKVKGIEISAKTGNINLLISNIKAFFTINSITVDSPTLQTERQFQLLEKAYKDILDSIKTINKNFSIDLIEEFLKRAFNHLNEIIGENYQENLLDEIFSRFCLGK